MKKIYTILALWCAVTATMGQNALKVEEYKLDNGLTVWINEDHSQPKVFGAVVVKAGAADCPDTGLAHYFEHILFKGTDKIGTVDYAKERPLLDSISMKYDELAATKDEAKRKEIQQEINRLNIKAADYAIPNEYNNLITRFGGSGLNAATSYDYTYYHNTFAPQYMEQWAELNSERLINPVFRLFQGELETVYEEKNMYADNPLMPAMDDMLKTFYNGSPYAYSVIGSTENLKNPRLSEMRKFYETYYVAGNMALILCGDINAAEVMPVIKRTFGRLRPGTAPSRPPFTLQQLDASVMHPFKIPLPIIKAIGRTYRKPGYGHPDNAALNMATLLLNNTNQTGLLDSLMVNSKLLMAVAGGSDMKDAGALSLLVVPKVPFGSKNKAESLCMEQIEKIKQGNFSEDMLDKLKRSNDKELKTSMESISKRADVLIKTFGNGLPLDFFIHYIEQMNKVTKADIVRVANQYFNDEYLHGVKKFGSYPKDKVSQPGYKPISPKNIGAQSDYAKALDSVCKNEFVPKLLDYDKAAEEISITDKVKLYAVKNPVNDVFGLYLYFHKGTRNDKRLNLVDDYINQLGVGKLSKLEFNKKLQDVGAAISTGCFDQSFGLFLTGFDNQLRPTLQLLNQFMNDLTPDKEKLKDMLRTTKAAAKSIDESNSSVANAMIEKVAYGNMSNYLNTSSLKEMQKLTPETLIDLFKQLQNMECSIVYCGTLDSQEVAAALRDILPVDKMKEKEVYVKKPLMQYTEPVVYIYNCPKTRQNIIATYTPLAPCPTVDERLRLNLWSRYFGNGMSSVMFQEIREMRSLAYGAYGYAMKPSLMLMPNYSTAYVAYMSTQADKTNEALHLLDSLFTDMPLREKNVEACKLDLLNSINNSYPTFRNIGSTILFDKRMGYTANPEEETVKKIHGYTKDDINDFFTTQVKGKPRITIVVGNKKTMDMKELAKYGRIVELKKEDLWNL